MENSDANLRPGPASSALPSEERRRPYVPDHELIRLIGSGSSGEVWLARNALGTFRAVKIVYERTFRHRRPFDREFNGVQNVEPISRQHDGLVDILQVGRNDAEGYFYCVMEVADDVVAGQSIVDPAQYLPRTLAHDISQYKRLPIADCAELGAAIASALNFLHERGLIHRDIKPSNIIFVHGVPKLADIGLVAELADARSYVGTDGFIPPEGPGSVQADIYSLGKVLYEISTGKDRHDYPELPAFLGDGAQHWGLIQLNKIILKACRADLNDRYRSASEMAEALRIVLTGKPPTVFWTRRRITNAIALVGFLVAASVITALIWRLVTLLQVQ